MRRERQFWMRKGSSQKANAWLLARPWGLWLVPESCFSSMPPLVRARASTGVAM